MDTLSTPEITQASVLNEKIRPFQLSTAFERYGTKIKILSLDCFDTLIWRKTATPIDVFYALQNRPSFQALGFTAAMRIRAESIARNQQFVQHIKTEVQLIDIYRASFPELNEAQLSALENDEIAAEVEFCYALPATVELIKNAKSKGLKIIIVSDTYFKQTQLRYLLEKTLPADCFAAIDKIFCSNEFGVSKTNGLFKQIIEVMAAPAQSILHIGDNYTADFVAARAKEINAMHLIQHDNNIAELFRMSATSASLMDTSIRHTRPLLNPFRGIFANHEFPTDKPEQLIGYATMGPIMYAFAHFLLNEITQLKQQGKRPKILFLMRDAYLPSRICETVAEDNVGKRVRISRFAAYAASFRTQLDVDRYLGEMVTSYRFADMAKQLLLPPAIAAQLVQQSSQASEPLFEFIQLLHQEHILEIIFTQSRAYRKRLLRHIQNDLELAPGDTLVFVDLGYSGTTQRLLEPVLRDELQIEVLGRYLIALSVPGWNTARKGLLDPSSCDERAMLALINYIALLEQLCTCNESSVTDYDENGNPIFSNSNISEQQHQNLDLIQAHCVRFAQDAKKFFANTTLSFELLRDTALSGIARLLFLPTQIEINYLESFKFDLNLGTTDTFKVFDQDAGLTSLKRRGLFAIFMERNAKSLRTNAPAELRAAGIELALTLMGQHRFCLEFGMNDLSLRHEQINIIVMRGSDITHAALVASLTHDGYFALCIPVGNCNLQIGILFGQKYQWIQFESAEIILSHAFLSSKETQHAEDVWSNIIFEQMVDKGEKLYECLSDSSLAIIAPPQKNNTHNYIMRIVFRPIMSRINNSKDILHGSN